MKDKLVKESISFERGKDPKNMLGIGILRPHTIKTIDELKLYFSEALPVIFDGKIPDDILSRQPKGIIPNDYFNKICTYMKDNGMTHEDTCGKISSDWEYGSGVICDNWVPILFQELKKLGYKEKITESYDEDEYENDLSLHEDPIYDEIYYALRDMGISDDVADDLVEKNAELIHEAEDQNFTIEEIAYMLKDRIK